MAFGRDRPSALSLLRQLGRLPDTLLAPARLHNHSKHRPFDANGMRRRPRLAQSDREGTVKQGRTQVMSARVSPRPNCERYRLHF